MVIILNKIKSRLLYSIRWKLFLTYLFVGFVPLVFVYTTIMASIEDHFRLDREKKLLTSANIIAGSILRGNYLTDFSEPKKMLFDMEVDEKSREGGFRVLVLDSKAAVINDSNKAEIGKTLVMPEIINALNRKSDIRMRKDEKAVYAAVTIENDVDEKLGLILLVMSVDDIYVVQEEIGKKLALFIALAGIVIVFIVFFMSQILIDPLNNILKVVRKMADGHLHQRVINKTKDEYSVLGQAFNTMSEKLEQVEKTRDDFVSSVSHELKTPLSAMKVLSEALLLQEDVPVEMYKEFLQDINSEVDRMTMIVNDLLELVKLDQRDVALNIKPTIVNKMVEDLLKRLYPLAKQKSIDLLYEDVREVAADCDEMKMSLAISNVVENSIKYSHDRGTIKVVVDADHQNAFITVQDTGIGISAEDQGKIFNRFYRVDKTRDRETGGTGLGLAITHSTVLLHNGSIRVISKENEGSTFIIRIPVHHM